ncbi:MAG: hypothetical protein E7813_11845 [Bradyrhizobium sp.]|uniref:hypothetical protein n=1 Tax=Bradyrhizobium sp. TaxID=376 RepID=UPI001213BB7B|nr:hypothetical protein [Bradyrhizobium sp.]THD67196.1 MAG: hypothetical protein E7813_11845 [Bradyrhizobium sp.]
MPHRRDEKHDCTVGTTAARVGKEHPNTWYVSVYVPREDTREHYSRRSQTFTSEDDAKQFATARLAEGLDVSAGTLNPVRPKRTIGPSQIEEGFRKNHRPHSRRSAGLKQKAWCCVQHAKSGKDRDRAAWIWRRHGVHFIPNNFTQVK